MLTRHHVLTADEWPALVHSTLRERYKASINSPVDVRTRFIEEIHGFASSPRPGTSGAANAYFILVGSEFGQPVASDRPGYHTEAGSDENWKLRIGKANAHFDEKWQEARKNTTLWNRLYRWLPDVTPDDPDVARTMFCWANLSVTSGGAHLGTRASHETGMSEHLAHLARASGCRVLAATNKPTVVATERWARENQATQHELDVRGEPLLYYEVPLRDAPPLFVAKVGHPSRGVSRVAWTSRLSALLDLAERHA